MGDGAKTNDLAVAGESVARFLIESDWRTGAGDDQSHRLWQRATCNGLRQIPRPGWCYNNSNTNMHTFETTAQQGSTVIRAVCRNLRMLISPTGRPKIGVESAYNLTWKGPLMAEGNGKVANMLTPPSETAVFRIGGQDLLVPALTLDVLDRKRVAIQAMSPELSITDYAKLVVEIIS